MFGPSDLRGLFLGHDADTCDFDGFGCKGEYLPVALDVLALFLVIFRVVDDANPPGRCNLETLKEIVELGIARAEVDEEDLEVVAVWVSLSDLVHLGNNVRAELVVEYVFDLFRGARGTSVADEKGCGRGRHGC